MEKKKQPFTTELICLSKQRAGSKITPRFLTFGWRLGSRGPTAVTVVGVLDAFPSVSVAGGLLFEGSPACQLINYCISQQASRSNHLLEITSGVFQISPMGRHPACGKTLDIMFGGAESTISNRTPATISFHCVPAVWINVSEQHFAMKSGHWAKSH